MQHTHDVDDDDFEYPENLQVKDVHVYVHPSCMFATHDYSCPVCRETHAVLSKGIMTPCRACRKEGWEVHKKDLRPWYKKIFS